MYLRYSHAFGSTARRYDGSLPSHGNASADKAWNGISASIFGETSDKSIHGREVLQSHSLTPAHPLRSLRVDPLPLRYGQHSSEPNTYIDEQAHLLA